MRAVQIAALDGPRAMRLAEVPEPDGHGNVEIEVHIAGVTFPDVLLTRGEYQFKPPLPFVPGSEVAGVVRRAPEDSGFVPGQRVAAFPAFGGFAEMVAVGPQLVFPLPDSTPFEQAAALPMNYLTMHFALTRRGRLRAGETVLVHGAAGGLGTAAVQLAKVYGAHVIAVVSTDPKTEVARAAGADEVILAEGFRDRVKQLTDGRGVDVVVDPVGGDRFTDSLRSLTREGRLLVLGFTGGEIPTVKVNRLLLNNISLLGVGWGAFWLAEPGYPREQWQELMPHIENGTLNPVLGSTYPLEDAAAAVTELDERRATGKVLLRVRR
ncbi:NADPH:quinone oxidoreductase family protein [Planosporangium mesophilum]|uniref:NADPH:quinone oxidoreductase n=1 Tax=Planosporangium mesophilum TaxID=689768 RepID=A0A8J3X0H5_9ACTN|nr:NADPH:quinone oxidoreductase family protein [Planosporangium mesophilum]NJC84466.1 NADPH:quinone oxidoreductase family protein [Planosporangium mesophilum]GII23390.1 NADPH:quinone oxidoreductase [Planosporangium mesophilum]